MKTFILALFLVSCGPARSPTQVEVGSFCRVNLDCPGRQVCTNRMGDAYSLGQCMALHQ
jgi:hypothetical protein